MGVTGDFDKLRKLRDNVAYLTKQGFRQELSSRMGLATMKLVADEFRGSHDPYGEPWKDLKHRQGKPLLDTGRMRASVFFATTSDGFKVTIPVAYAPVHQFGAKIAPRSSARAYGKQKRPATFNEVVIPQRMMLPVRERGLPATYVTAYNRTAAALIKAKLSGGGEQEAVAA